MSDLTLKERLEDLESKLAQASEEEKKKREKKFKFPFGKKVSTGQKSKNWITVIKLNENNFADIKKLKIDDQTIMEDGIPRLATAQYVYYYKKNPIIILPSWSVEPLCSSKMINESLNDGSNKKGYKILMDKMLKETVNPKKPMPGIVKWIFGAIILGIIGYAFLSGGV